MENNYKSNINYYENHYKQANKNFTFEKHKKLIWRENKKLLNDKSKKILDLGCGAGFLLKALEDLGFNNLTGVDINASQIKRAKINTSSAKIYNCEILNFLKNASEKYDLIFLYDVIEHIEKEKIIEISKEIYKSLNPDGKLIIKTINADSPFFSGMTRYGDFTHEISFNKRSISFILREGGFKSIKCYPEKSNLRLFFIKFPVRFTMNIIIKIYMASYHGLKMFSVILTPRLMVIAKK